MLPAVLPRPSRQAALGRLHFGQYRQNLRQNRECRSFIARPWWAFKSQQVFLPTVSHIDAIANVQLEPPRGRVAAAGIGKCWWAMRRAPNVATHAAQPVQALDVSGIVGNVESAGNAARDVTALSCRQVSSPTVRRLAARHAFECRPDLQIIWTRRKREPRP
jgi:hypothetical protein